MSLNPLKWLIRPIIGAEIGRTMKQVVGPVLGIVQAITDRYGTKWLIGLAAIGAVNYLAYLDKLEGWIAAVVSGVVAITYFWFRRQQEKDNHKTIEVQDGSRRD